MPPTTPLPIAAAKVRMKMARSSMVASPDTGCRGAADIIGKVVWRTSQRALHAIGQRRVAAVEHGGEQIDHEIGLNVGDSACDQLRAKLPRRGRGEADVPPGRLRDLADRVSEGQSPRAC